MMMSAASQAKAAVWGLSELGRVVEAVFEGAQRGDAKKVTEARCGGAEESKSGAAPENRVRSEALNAHGDPNCINFGGFNAPRTEGFRGEIGSARALQRP